MRVGFAGTPAFAAHHLETLHRHCADLGLDLVAVLSQPDRAAGRGRRLTPSPVSAYALDHGLCLYTPVTLRGERAEGASAQARLRASALDLLIVVAYGLILPRAVLEAPTHGCVNVHASLLPRWRGAAPIQRAVEAGDDRTGICLMQMEEGLDTGPIWMQEALPIDTRETASVLQGRLAALGADLLVRFLRERPFLNGCPTPQSTEGVTYAHKLGAEDRWVRFDRPVQEVINQVRSLESVPSAVSVLRGETLKLGGAVLVETQGHWGPPGAIVRMGERDEGIVVACGQGLMGLSWLQRPGGRPTPGAVVARAMRLSLGDQFQRGN